MSENGCGGPTDDSTATEKGVSLECPTCGRDDFDSSVGLGMHRRRSHGEDVSSYPKLDDREWLAEQYVENYRSTGEIAEMVGCTQKTVSDYLEKHDIDTRSGAYGNVLDEPLSEKALSVIRGELLGDGCIATRHDNSHSAWYIHGTSREEYRDWLKSWLEEQGFYVRSSVDHENRFRDGEPKSDYKLSTRGYRCLYRIWERWYPNGEKRVPEDLTLTPTMLRHWYIGDGSHMQKWNQIRLHSEGFTRECTEILTSALSEVGVSANVQKNNAIFVPTESYSRFFEYMGPLPPEIESTYGYKWP